MPRRRREHDPERLGDELHRWDGNHSTSRVSSRRRQDRSSYLRNYPSMLASAVLNDKEKNPLFTARDGHKTIRLRTLQHMIVCNLRRELAGQVKTICDTNSAADMENIRKTMKHYGLQAISVSLLSIQTAKYLDSLCTARPWLYVGEPKPKQQNFRVPKRPAVHFHERRSSHDDRCGLQ